jgi:hypothetical protein
MGTTQTTGSGGPLSGAAAGIVRDADIAKREAMADGSVRVTLKSGEVLVGKTTPDGRIIRGAGTDTRT